MADTHPGDTEALHQYWVHGKGAAEIRWGTSGDHDRCVRQLVEHAKFTPEQAHGYCNLAEHAATGRYPAQHAAAEKGHRSMTTTFTRSYPLDDIRVRSGGDGRTVEAYAAVFDTPSEIRDQDGHYQEVISRSAFDKTIAERGGKFGVFYNHGLTLHGTPSDRHSMPIGTPTEVRADARGVFTVTRYNRTPLADEVLEAIKEGAITGQSFSGRMLQSTPKRGPFRPSRGGELPTVTRSEIALREYGPTPFPAYEDASIMGVRALLRAYELGGVDLESEDDDGLLAVLRAAITGRGDTDDASATPEPEPETRPDTPVEGAVTAEPDPMQGHHSGPVMTRAQARARLLKRGILL